MYHKMWYDGNVEARRAGKACAAEEKEFTLGHGFNQGLPWAGVNPGLTLYPTMWNAGIVEVRVVGKRCAEEEQEVACCYV